MAGKKIIIKTKKEIENIKESGKYLTELLYLLINKTKVGVNLLELEEIAQNYIDKNGVKGAFKGYKGFPANLCLSVNDCVVHGIPEDCFLKNGDLLKIDCGINYKGGISDSAVSLVIGAENDNVEGYNLIKNTKLSLDKSLEYVKPFKKLNLFGKSIYDGLKKSNFNVIKNLTGHGVGRNVHELPHIYNYNHPSGKKDIFKPGMVVALEPITAIKSEMVIEKIDNGRNLYTQYGDDGAQWEYTILISDGGNEIISGVEDNIFCTA